MIRITISLDETIEIEAINGQKIEIENDKGTLKTKILR